MLVVGLVSLGALGFQEAQHTRQRVAGLERTLYLLQAQAQKQAIVHASDQATNRAVLATQAADLPSLVSQEVRTQLQEAVEAYQAESTGDADAETVEQPATGEPMAFP